MINLAMICFGAFLIILGIMLLLISLSRGGMIKGGGVILIGPFPIILGGRTPAIVAMVLTAILLAAFLFFLFTGIIAGGWR